MKFFITINTPLIIALILLSSGCATNKHTLAWQDGGVHYTVKYAEGDEDRGKTVMDALPHVIKELHNFYGERFKLKQKVKIEIIQRKEAEEYKNRASGANYLISPWSENIELRPNAFEPKRNTSGVLAHEMNHSLLRNYYGTFNYLTHRPPRWIDEGISNYFAHDYFYSVEYLKEVLKEQPELPNDAKFLYDNAEFNRLGKSNWKKIYAISRALVERLINQMGRDGFFDLVDGLKQGEKIGKVFSEKTGQALEDFYQSWLKEFRQEKHQ